MKAKTLVETTGSNPGYNRQEALAAKAGGREYLVKRKVVYPPGTVIEHPLVWIHCCKSRPTMEPADEECRAAVRKFLENPQRKEQLRKLKQMVQPEVLKHLSPEMQKYVKAVAAKWLTGPAADTGDDSSKQKPLK